MLKVCIADVMEFMLILLILFVLQLRLSLPTHPPFTNNQQVQKITSTKYLTRNVETVDVQHVYI